MDPTMVLMGIQAAVRLSRAGNAAFGQYARDREILLPMVEKVKLNTAESMKAFLFRNADDINPDLKGYRDSYFGDGAHFAGDADMMAVEYFRIMAMKNGAAEVLQTEASGYWMIAQWGKAGPVGPLGRVLITMTDVAVQFAAKDPTLFGASGRAEPLVKVLALYIHDLVPDDSDDLGPKNQLGERLAGIFLRASLKAMSDHPEALVDETHLQTLVRNTLPKLLEQLPDGLDLPAKSEVVEALLGPVAQAALITVAEHPGAFLGSGAEDDDLVGALTRTFLLKAADIGLGQTLTQSGAILLYKAGLGLATARPELFLGVPSSQAEQLVGVLFGDLAATLERHSPPFDHTTVTELLATTVEVVGANGVRLVEGDNPWSEVFVRFLSPVLGALGQSMQTDSSAALRQLTSGEALKRFVRTVLDQASRSPGMIGVDGEELGRIVAAVAGAMAKDEDMLLVGEDWLIILSVACEEAAANPARLFGLKHDAVVTDVAVPLIENLLKVAAAQWKASGRAGGAVLFGTTLREAIVTTLRVAAGNAEAALTNAAALQQLAEAVGTIVTANPGRYGSKEWLRVYRALIQRVLRDGSVGVVDVETVESILAGGR